MIGSLTHTGSHAWLFVGVLGVHILAPVFVKQALLPFPKPGYNSLLTDWGTSQLLCVQLRGGTRAGVSLPCVSILY